MQGLTVDNAVIHLDGNCNRYDAFVASSRARDRSILVVDARAIDRQLAYELPLDRQRDGLVFADAERRTWLAERLSRASPKISTLDVIEGARPLERKAGKVRHPQRELSHEL